MRLVKTVRFELNTNLFHTCINRDACELMTFPYCVTLLPEEGHRVFLERIKCFCRNLARTVKNNEYTDKKMYELCLNRIVKIEDEHNPKAMYEFYDKEYKFILATNDRLIRSLSLGNVLGSPIKTTVKVNCSNQDFVYIERYDGYEAQIRPLTLYEDIVVDTNLNQIWPAATTKPPVGLVEILKKANEKVY